MAGARVEKIVEWIQTITRIRPMLRQLNDRLMAVETVSYKGNTPYRIRVPEGITVEQAWEAAKAGVLPYDPDGSTYIVVVSSQGHIMTKFADNRYRS